MSTVLLEDVNNKLDHHAIKHNYWEKQGIEIMRYRLPVGDYVLANDKIFDVIARKKARGIQPKMMDFLGTYNVCCDSKFDIGELVSGVCGKQHDRLRDECILAQNNGIRLFFVVENKGGLIKGTKIINPTIRRLEDLHKWVNPRLCIFKSGKQAYPSATRGKTLMKACMTLRERYKCDFVFCTPEESGKLIVDILRGEFDG